MEKEEILQRSRNENFDEGSEYAENKGRILGLEAMTIAFVIIIFYNFFRGISNKDVYALWWIYVGFEAYGSYRITKKKSSLTLSCISIFAGITYLIIHIIYS